MTQQFRVCKICGALVNVYMRSAHLIAIHPGAAERPNHNECYDNKPYHLGGE